MLEGPTPVSWTDIRASRLLDSGVSGGLAGGILNAWKRMLDFLIYCSFSHCAL